MKKLALGSAILGLSLAVCSQSALAGDPSGPACKHCCLGHVRGFIGKFAPKACCCTGGQVMTGNSGLGHCGKACIPGPWYTYWPEPGQHNLTSPYQMQPWTYLSHFQTPAPLGRMEWQTPDPSLGGFAGIPYYWSGR